MKYFIHLPMKMELIEGSETSAIRTQTPGNYPKENIFHTNIVEKIKKIHILCLVNFFENRVVHEVVWKNVVESDRPQMTVWH